MCRYIAYMGPPIYLKDLVYEASNGLVHQASDAMDSPTRTNADGFGVGWYHPQTSTIPAVFKDITPAWSNANLRSIAGIVESGCIMAHVRAAARHDPISRANCHPFHDGRLLWMHNGDVPGRGRFHRRVVGEADDDLVARIHGNTDTELAFVLFRSFLGRSYGRDFGVEELADALERTLETIVRWQREASDAHPLALNLCVTDGRSLVASRYALGDLEIPTLYYCTGGRFACVDGVCVMVQDGSCQRSVIVASEPLSDDPQWTPIEPSNLLVVRHDRSVEHRRLDIL